jgi:hypothetical protein
MYYIYIYIWAVVACLDGNHVVIGAVMVGLVAGWKRSGSGEGGGRDGVVQPALGRSTWRGRYMSSVYTSITRV